MLQFGVSEMEEIEALAESWAFMDGKVEEFKDCKISKSLEDEYGHYGGYMADAEEMIKRLERRGYYLKKFEE